MIYLCNLCEIGNLKNSFIEMRKLNQSMYSAVVYDFNEFFAAGFSTHGVSLCLSLHAVTFLGRALRALRKQRGCWLLHNSIDAGRRRRDIIHICQPVRWKFRDILHSTRTYIHVDDCHLATVSVSVWWSEASRRIPCGDDSPSLVLSFFWQRLRSVRKISRWFSLKITHKDEKNGAGEKYRHRINRAMNIQLWKRFLL